MPPRHLTQLMEISAALRKPCLYQMPFRRDRLRLSGKVHSTPQKCRLRDPPSRRAHLPARLGARKPRACETPSRAEGPVPLCGTLARGAGVTDGAGDLANSAAAARACSARQRSAASTSPQSTTMSVALLAQPGRQAAEVQPSWASWAVTAVGSSPAAAMIRGRDVGGAATDPAVRGRGCTAACARRRCPCHGRGAVRRCPSGHRCRRLWSSAEGAVRLQCLLPCRADGPAGAIEAVHLAPLPAPVIHVHLHALRRRDLRSRFPAARGGTCVADVGGQRHRGSGNGLADLRRAGLARTQPSSGRSRTGRCRARARAGAARPGPGADRAGADAAHRLGFVPARQAMVERRWNRRWPPG